MACLLLGGHVGHQVTDTVAVAELIVVPGGNKKRKWTHWLRTPVTQTRGNKPKNTHVPCDQLDEVIVEGDASTSIKDGGVGVAVEVCGHNLREKWTAP